MSTCHLCGTGELRELSQYASLSRVTSDCKPWPPGGRLGVCGRCGTVQKFADARWTAEIARIYADYTIYFQAGGAEQAVFVGDAARPRTRSEWLVQHVIEHARLAPAGRLLDIGCGNGAFLQAFSAAMPGWSLAGTEQSDATRAIVERIPRVEALHTGPLERVPGSFDVISMTHVLEHIARPLDLLRTAVAKLRPRGVVFIQVPDARSNPFDLVIADHVSHFTPATAAALVESAGLTVCASAAWVAKEFSMLCRPGPPAAPGHADEAGAVAGLEWLMAVRDAVRAARAGAAGPFGLFGSSIAATWLAQEVDGEMEFFVDEDPSRQGQRFGGRPVVRPGEVPSGSTVFVGIGGGVAEQVVSRLARAMPSVSWIAAPPLR